VVISDDMQMGAIRKEYGFATAVLRAIDAGVDILTISNDTPFVPGIVGSTIDMIEGFVTSGKLTEARIDASWQRIRRLKGL
jgi:beta-N-acetylhexosaminidase